MANERTILSEWIGDLRPGGRRIERAKPFVLDAFGNAPRSDDPDDILDAACDYIARHVNPHEDAGTAFPKVFWGLNVASYAIAFHGAQPYGLAQEILHQSAVNQLRRAREAMAVTVISSGAGVHQVAERTFFEGLPSEERKMHDRKYQTSNNGRGGKYDVLHISYYNDGPAKTMAYHHIMDAAELMIENWDTLDLDRLQLTQANALNNIIEFTQKLVRFSAGGLWMPPSRPAHTILGGGGVPNQFTSGPVFS